MGDPTEIKKHSGSTPEIEGMIRNKVPVTLENWLKFVFAGMEVPENWNQEMDVPQELRAEYEKLYGPT